jgi:hypothetical protein
VADEPLTVLQAALLEAVRPTPAGRPPRRHAPDPLAAHGCLHAAVLVTPRGERIWYPCRSHDGGVHHFAAHWPACPAPWCRLPAAHAAEGTMHDIPPGTVEYHDETGAAGHVR